MRACAQASGEWWKLTVQSSEGTRARVVIALRAVWRLQQLGA